MAYEDSGRGAQSVRRPNNVTLENRRKLTVTGVEEVERFDENEITLRTGEGDLVIRGGEMRIGRLSTDNGDVSVSGRIDALFYEESAPERGLWARLFH